MLEAAATIYVIEHSLGWILFGLVIVIHLYLLIKNSL